VLLAQDPVWRNKVDAIFHLSLPDKPGPSYGQFKKWLGEERALSGNSMGSAY
jgi:hypothetical protein